MKILLKRHNFFTIFSLIFCVFFTQVFAQEFPEKPTKLVSDFAKILSPQENQLLEERLLSYEKETSTQIAVVTLQSLNGYPIDDYAIKLGNKWQIGQKGKNNGLLILIAAKDHKIFIASGYGMEGALNDGKLGTIIRRQMIPQFKNGNNYAAINNGLDAIIAAAAGEFVNENLPEKKDAKFFAAVFGFILLFFTMMFFMKGANQASAVHPFIFYGNGLNRRNYDSNSHRGFNGFGGGGFGGGGAGGSW